MIMAITTAMMLMKITIIEIPMLRITRMTTIIKKRSRREPGEGS